jgi:predicted ATP-grasp superfamily ATP-dependent carboligase
VLAVLVHEWVTGGGLAGAPLPGSWEREGSAMRRAIARDFAAISDGDLKVVMTLDARLPAEPGPWRVESIGPGEHDPRIRELCRTADFTVLVAPETRGILAEMTRDLESSGTRMLGSSAAAVDLTGDKARLAAHLERYGIDTPPASVFVPSEGLPESARYPAVLKPVDGAGSLDTFYLDGPADLSDHARQMPRALLQPFVPGDPMSASFLVSPEGRSWLIAIGRQQMKLRDGRFEYHGGEIPVPCPGGAAQVRAALAAIEGLAGFVGVDFIWNVQSRRATILEINPRPTTSLVGLCRLLPPGLLARAWLKACRPARRDDELLESLSAKVQAQEAVVFDAGGQFAGRCE